MDSEKQRKETILKEILFWKKNKLLPEQYCDFLTQLYTEGRNLTDEGEVALANQSLLKSPKIPMRKIVLFACIAIVLLVFVAALFILGSKLVYIPIVLGVIIFTVTMYYIFKTAHNKTLTTTFALATAALLLFAVSVRLTGILFVNSNAAILSVVIVNCVIWLVAGRYLKLIYFTISGILGIVLVSSYILFSLLGLA